MLALLSGNIARPNSRGRLARLSASAAALALGMSAAAQAQTQAAAPNDSVRVEEIVVTAQKREQRLQDVPVAVTALAGETMVGNRVATLQNLTGLVPNLIVHSQVGGQSLPRYTLRGLTAGGSATGADKGVAIYVDGVFMAASYGSMFEFADIERIEVLRGPQGTLFGRNSTGGGISIITPEPKGKFALKQKLTVGNYSQVRTTTTLNTAELNGVSAMVAYTHSQRRGDIRNLAAGTKWDFTAANNGKTLVLESPKWLGGTNVESVNAAVKFEPNDRFKAIYRFDYSQTDYSQAGIGISYAPVSLRNLLATQPAGTTTIVSSKRPDAVNNGSTVPSELKVFGHALTMTYDVADNVTIKNILAYRKMRFIAPMADITGAGYLINNNPTAFASVLGASLAASTVGAPVVPRPSITKGYDKQWSDELQLNVDTRLVTFTSGALYFNNEPSRGYCCEFGGIGQARSPAYGVYPGFALPFTGQPQFTRGRPTTVKIVSYAFYGQAEVHVTPQIDLIAGGRYTNDRKKGVDFNQYSGTSSTAFILDYKGDKFTYNVGANYKVNTDLLLYAKYSTGFISGGALAGISYEPEVAKSLEGGMKADWFDRRVRTNLAVFSVKYDNLQFGSSGLALTPPNPAITQLVTNAGNAKAKGFEFEGTFVPTRNVTLSAAVGHTDFKFTSLKPFVLNGNSAFLVQYRPKWTANLSGAYTSDPLFDDVTFSARFDANWHSNYTMVSSVNASLTGAERAAFIAGGRIPAYWVVNSRVSLQGFKLAGSDASIGLWARNLFDNKQVNFGILIVPLAVDYERARTVGADLVFEF